MYIVIVAALSAHDRMIICFRFVIQWFLSNRIKKIITYSYIGIIHTNNKIAYNIAIKKLSKNKSPKSFTHKLLDRQNLKTSHIIHFVT